MKKQARFTILQAAGFDPTAAKIFIITRRVFNIAMLASLILLTAAQFVGSSELPEQAGLALCHAAFRMAAMGAVTGFTADIVLRRSRK